MDGRQEGAIQDSSRFMPGARSKRCSMDRMETTYRRLPDRRNPSDEQVPSIWGERHNVNRRARVHLPQATPCSPYQVQVLTRTLSTLIRVSKCQPFTIGRPDPGIYASPLECHQFLGNGSVNAQQPQRNRAGPERYRGNQLSVR